MTECTERICRTFDNFKLKWWLRRAGDAKRRRQLLNKLKHDLQSMKLSTRAVRRGLFQLCTKPYVVLERISLDIYYREMRLQKEDSMECSVSEKIWLDEEQYPSISQDISQAPEDQIVGGSVRLDANAAVGTTLSDLTVSVNKNKPADIQEQSMQKEKVVDHSFLLQNKPLETFVPENAFESRFNESNDNNVSSSNDVIISKPRAYSARKVKDASDEIEFAPSSKEHTQTCHIDSVIDLVDEQRGAPLVQNPVKSLRIKLNLKPTNQKKDDPLLKVNPEVTRKEEDNKYSDISSSEEILNSNKANSLLDKNVTVTDDEISDSVTSESKRIDEDNANKKQVNWKEIKTYYALNRRRMFKLFKLKKEENRKQRRRKKPEKIRQKFRDYFGETILKSESEEEHKIVTEKYWNIQKFVDDKSYSIKGLMIKKDIYKRIKKRVRERTKSRAHKRKLSFNSQFSSQDDTEDEIPTKSVAFTENFLSDTYVKSNEDISYAIEIDNMHMSIKDLHILRQSIQKELDITYAEEKEEMNMQKVIQNVQEDQELNNNENADSMTEETRESETGVKSSITSTKESPFHNIQEKNDIDNIERGDVLQNIENSLLNNNDSTTSDVKSATINNASIAALKSEENLLRDECIVSTLTDASISPNQSDRSDDDNDDDDDDDDDDNDNDNDNNENNDNTSDLEIQIKIKPKSKSQVSRKFLLQAPFSVLNSYLKNLNVLEQNPDFLSALFEANLRNACQKTTHNATIGSEESNTSTKSLEVNQNVPAEIIDTVSNTQEAVCDFSYIAKDNSLQQENFRADTTLKARNATKDNEEEKNEQIQPDEQERTRIITTNNSESTGSMCDMPDLGTLPNIQNITCDHNRITKDNTNSFTRQDVTILNKNTMTHNQEERNEHVQSFEQEKTQSPIGNNSESTRSTIKSCHWKKVLSKISLKNIKKSWITSENSSASDKSACDTPNLEKQPENNTILNEEENAVKNNQEEKNDRVQSINQEKTCITIESSFESVKSTREMSNLEEQLPLNMDNQKKKNKQIQSVEQEKTCITIESSFESTREMPNSEEQSSLNTKITACDSDSTIKNKNSFTIRVRSSAELRNHCLSTPPSIPNALIRSNITYSGSCQVPPSNTNVTRTAPHTTTKNISHNITDVRHQSVEKMIKIICSNYILCRNIYKSQKLNSNHLQQMMMSVHQIKEMLLNLQKIWNTVEYSDTIGYINQYISKKQYQLNKIADDELLIYHSFLESPPSDVCDAPYRSFSHAPTSNVNAQQFLENIPHGPSSMAMNPNNSQSSALPRMTMLNIHQQQFKDHYFSYTQHLKQPPSYVSQQYSSNAPHYNSNIPTPNSSQQQSLRNTSYFVPDMYLSDPKNRQSFTKYNHLSCASQSNTTNVNLPGYGLANQGNTNVPLATDKRYYASGSRTNETALASTVNTSQQNQIYCPLAIQTNSVCPPSNISSNKQQNAYNATPTVTVNNTAYHKTGTAARNVELENSCINPQAQIPQVPSEKAQFSSQYNTLNTTVITSSPCSGQIHVAQNTLLHCLPVYVGVPANLPQQNSTNPISQQQYLQQNTYVNQPSQQNVINLTLEQQHLQQNLFTNRSLQHNSPTANVRQSLRANQSSQQNLIINSTMQRQNSPTNRRPQQNLANSSLQQQKLCTNHPSQRNSPTANVQQNLQQNLRANQLSQQILINSTLQQQNLSINRTPPQNLANSELQQQNLFTNQPPLQKLAPSTMKQNMQQNLLQKILPQQNNLQQNLPINMSKDTTSRVVLSNKTPKEKQTALNKKAKIQNMDCVPNKIPLTNPQQNVPQGNSGTRSISQNSSITAPKTFISQKPFLQSLLFNKSSRTSETDKTASSTKNTPITSSNQISVDIFDLNIFTDLQKVLLRDQLNLYFNMAEWRCPVISEEVKKLISEKIILSLFHEALHNHVNTIISASQTVEKDIEEGSQNNVLQKTSDIKKNKKQPASGKLAKIKSDRVNKNNPSHDKNLKKQSPRQNINTNIPMNSESATIENKSLQNASTDKTKMPSKIVSNENTRRKSNPGKVIEVQKVKKMQLQKIPSPEIPNTENICNTSNAVTLNNNKKDDVTLQTPSNTADQNTKICNVNDQTSSKNQESEMCNIEESNCAEKQSDASPRTSTPILSKSESVLTSPTKRYETTEISLATSVKCDSTIDAQTALTHLKLMKCNKHLFLETEEKELQKLTPTEIRETENGSDICNVVSLSDEILERTDNSIEKTDNEMFKSSSRLFIDENADISNSQCEQSDKEPLFEEDKRNVSQDLRNPLEMEKSAIKKQSPLLEDNAEIDFVNKSLVMSEQDIENVNKQLPLETKEMQLRKILSLGIPEASSAEENTMQSIDIINQSKNIEEKNVIVDTHSNIKAINELLRHVSEQKYYGKLRVSPCSSTKNSPICAIIKEDENASMKENVKVGKDADVKESVNVPQNVITKKNVDVKEDVNAEEEDASVEVNVIQDVIIKEELNLEEVNVKGVNVHENTNLKKDIKEHVNLDEYINLDQDSFATTDIFNANIIECSSNSDNSESTNLPNILDIQSISLSIFENFDNIGTSSQDPLKLPKKEKKEKLIDINDNSEMTKDDMENEMENLLCLRCKRKSTVFCKGCLEASYCSVRCSQLHWRSHHYKVCKSCDNKSVVYID